MMNNLGKGLTYHNEPQKFYPEIFSLQGYRIKGIEQEANEILIQVELKRKTGPCPVCQKKTRRIHQCQKERRVWHKMIGDVYI